MSSELLLERLRQPPDQRQPGGDADREQHGEPSRRRAVDAGEHGDDVAADEERHEPDLGLVERRRCIDVERLRRHAEVAGEPRAEPSR